MSSHAAQSDGTTPNEYDHSHGLYRHRKCRQWGLAILAWERGDKRGYQFEDGTLRVFKRGFYSLFEEVDPPKADASNLVNELSKRLEVSLAQAKARTKARRDKPQAKAPWSFEDQVRIFRHLYPGGFNDPKWLEKNRGVGASRRLKRHRQPAIDSAQSEFSLERIDGMIEAGRFGDIVTQVLDHIKATNLVTNTQMQPLQNLAQLQQRGFVLALRNLLHSTEDPFPQRFERFLSTLRPSPSSTPSWQLVTVITALFDPDNHVCIRPSTFRKQLPEMAPGAHLGKGPNAKTYGRMRKMAELLQRRLKAEGLECKDMFDVHDFIWTTLRPAAGTVLKELT